MRERPFAMVRSSRILCIYLVDSLHFFFYFLHWFWSKAHIFTKIKFDEIKSYWNELKAIACCYGNGNGWLLAARPNIKYASYSTKNKWTPKPLNGGRDGEREIEKTPNDKLGVNGWVRTFICAWAWECLE